MKKYPSSIFFFLLWISIYGQLPLDNQIRETIRRYNLHSSVVAVSIHDIDNDKPIASIRGDSYMIPASSLKIITTFSALDKIGKDYRFDTKLGYTGEIESDGTLKGDIWIIGSGDPSLGSSRDGFGPSYQKLINDIVNVIKGRGISCIDGYIYVDASRFDNEGSFPGWSWNDVGNYYGGGIYGFNINENEYKIVFNRDMNVSEETTIAALDPPIPGLVFDNQVILAEAGTGDNAYIYGGEGFFFKTIKGTIPAGKGKFTIKGSMPDPPGLAAFLIFKSLEENGISSFGYKTSTYNSVNRFTSLFSFKSQNLESLVKIANEKSINLYCEAFLKLLSEKGSREDGISIIVKHLSDIGLDTMAIIQQDGSGLSSRNVITPKLFTSFLTLYYNKWGKSVLDILPRASHEGTVRGMLRTKASKGQAWLKSGFIGGVLTYTGYLRSTNGNILAVSIMINNYKGSTSEMRRLSEDILDLAYQKFK